MKLTIYEIGVLNLAIAVIPILVVIAILMMWSLKSKTAMYASVRMLVQLTVVGYVLTSIFALDNAGIVVIVLALMLLLASWIALRPLRQKSTDLYAKALFGISVGGISTLALTTFAVLQIDYWYQPQYVIPLAGMIFSNAMNTVSLAAERFESDMAVVPDYIRARNSAFTAALIPSINTFFAVGLVAFPGMMTGQILSGVSPLIAVKYQIVIMSVLFGSSGASAAIYLYLQRHATAPARDAHPG
ncbi:MAG: ABC transporter permease [Gammaproteobacteria bacterium]|nr:ABC transporter permease [Gammaproteobacteria bacterium]